MNLHSRERYPLPWSLAVGIYHTRALTLPGLLWNLQPERAGLTCHRAGLIDVSCKTIPPEEANQDVQILQCWHACAFDDEKWAITMVMYCSWMMYKYYSCLGFFPIKHNEEGKENHNEIFNIIPHFIKTICMLIFFKMVLLCTRLK